MVITLDLNSQNLSCVDDVRYTAIESNTLLLPSNVAFEDIHPYDIPGFKNTEETNSHHEFVDMNNNPQHEIQLTYSVNSYEDWEELPNKWLINQNGITSYKASLKGVYEEIDYIPHTGMSNAFFMLHKRNVIENGLLASKVYPRNIQLVLNNNNIPHIVIDPNTIVVCDSNICTIYNDNPPRTITTVIYETGGPQTDIPNINDPNVIGVEISVFDTEQCQEYLLSSKTEVNKDTLSNGLCAKRIIETLYTDYIFECCKGVLEPRSSEMNKLNFSIHPNPLNSDLMKIRLPIELIGNDVDISIHTIGGELLKKYTTYIGAKQLTIKVGKYLETQGLYVMRIVSKDNILTKKFFFVNK